MQLTPCGGADDLVVAPAVPVEGVGVAAADLVQRAQVGRHRGRLQEAAGPQQRLGDVPVEVRCAVGEPLRVWWECVTGVLFLGRPSFAAKDQPGVGRGGQRDQRQ